MEAAEEISRVLANIWLRKYKDKFSSRTEQHLLIISIYCLLYGEPHLNTQGVLTLLQIVVAGGI